MRRSESGRKETSLLKRFSDLSEISAQAIITCWYFLWANLILARNMLFEDVVEGIGEGEEVVKSAECRVPSDQ